MACHRLYCCGVICYRPLLVDHDHANMLNLTYRRTTSSIYYQ